jgi:outer membrane protein assembly factor BamB
MDSWSSALVADKKIYVGSRGGDFWILESGKKLNVIDSVQLDAQIHSTPVASKGVLYLSTLDKLYAIKNRQ